MSNAMYKVPVLQHNGTINSLTVIESDFDVLYGEFAKNLPVGVELCDTLESIKAKRNLHIIYSLIEFDKPETMKMAAYDSYMELFENQDTLVISNEYYVQRLAYVKDEPKEDEKKESNVDKVAKLLVPDQV